MSVWSYRDNVIADLVIHLLEQGILFVRIFLQQDINEITLQYSYADIAINGHTMFVIIFEMISLLLLNVTGDIFCYVADIYRAEDILRYEQWLCAGEVFNLQSVFEGLICRLQIPSEMIKFPKAA